MNIEPQEMRRRLHEARVARLGTFAPDGRPHLVPCVFVFEGDTIYTPIDHKRKRTRRLQRLRNIEANPEAALLVDHYSESWDECWWVRLRGRARILHGGDEYDHARALMMARYKQYSDAAQISPVIAIDIDEWVGWQARE
jgi:PPOX class probable F420-dependent enzyme